MQLVPYPARFARHLPHAGKVDRAAALGCSPKRHTCDDRPTYLSYRHCPIRLALLATFPTRGRLCPSLFFFSTYPVFALTMREKRHPRIAAFPIGEEGPRQRRSDAFVNGALVTIYPLFFIPLVPYPARFARHLPLEGKALSVVILFLHVSCIRFDDTRIPSSKKRRRSRHESHEP